jgi:FkbM family methyltransferase
MFNRIYNRLIWFAKSFFALFIEFKEIKFDNVSFKIHVNNSHEFNRALTFNSKEEDTLAWLKNNPGLDLVDIGANVGIYSLYFAKLSENSQIYSFEPDASSFTSLVKNISVNSTPNIKAFCIALGSRKGFYEMNFHDFAAGAGAGAIDSEYMFTNARDKKKYTQQTFCETLDNCSEKLIMTENCLVKIDVDGPEYEIINSGKNFLSSNKVKSVMIEINSKNEKDKHKIFSLMQSYGYKQIYQGNWIEKYKDYDISNFFFFKSPGFDFRKNNIKSFFKEISFDLN